MIESQTQRSAAATAGHNPFSTRFVRPGAIPFVFSAGHSAATCVDRLDEVGGWGQIIGPHGSGKSTLLCAIVAELKRRGRSVHAFALHDGQRRLALHPASWKLDSVVVVDGYEQLNFGSRSKLKWCCWRRAANLLVTCHRQAGFATIYRTEVELPLALRIVRQLQHASPVHISEQHVQAALQRHSGNLREALFECYDVFATRHGASPKK